MTRKSFFALLLLFAAAFGAASAPVAAAQDRRFGRQTITGTVIHIGGGPYRRVGTTTRQFRLIVNNYTTPEEVGRLEGALREGGQDRLLRELDRLDAGQIQVGTGVGVTANAIIASPYEGGTKLTVLYQRDVRFNELRFGTRSADYRFGYAEIFLARDGRGEGTMIPAAQVRLRGGNTWEVEDFGIYPARLVGLRVRGSGRAG